MGWLGSGSVDWQLGFLAAAVVFVLWLSDSPGPSWESCGRAKPQPAPSQPADMQINQLISSARLTNCAAQNHDDKLCCALT